VCVCVCVLCVYAYACVRVSPAFCDAKYYCM
jgi:hypothetical protein